MPAADGSARRRTAAQAVALAVGAFYTVLGLAGFAVTGFGGGHQGHELFGVAVSPLHNAVHLVVGVAGLALAVAPFGVPLYGWLLLLGFGAAFVYGLVAIEEPWDALGLDWANNWVHLASALVGLALTLVPARAGPSRSSLEG